jgi:uncharacterized protein (TIGR02246 family)
MAATEPEELAQAFAEAIRSGDGEAAAALFEPEAVLTTQQGNVCNGADEVRKLLEGYAAMKPPLRIRNLKTLRAGDLALLYNAPSHEGVAAEGRAVEVARRQPDGAWRYVMVFHPTG